MKKLRNLIPLLFIMLLPFGCDDVLNEARPGSPTEDQFMDSEEKFEFLVAGTYQKLIFYYKTGNPRHIHGFWLLPDDNLTLEQGSALGYDNFALLNSNTSYLNNYYEYSYQIINRANTALDFQREERYGFLYEDQELRSHHRGELLFLRGYMYLNLWNFFKDVPLNIEVIDQFDQTIIGNSSNDAALDQAITDLTEAASLLRDKPARGGGVWNETAYGMLGKALMMRGAYANNTADFSAALAEFEKITSRSLAPEFGDNFKEATELNDESLFEVMAGRNSQLNNWVLDNDNFNVVGNLGAYWGIFTNRFGYDDPTTEEDEVETDPTWVRQEHYLPTDNLVALLDVTDARYPETVDTAIFPLEVKKYMNSPQTHRNEWARQHNNPRILRYADILLLQAEAIVRTGGSVVEAIGIVNQIRARAGAVDAASNPDATFVLYDPAGATADQALDWIFLERRIELAFEESHRWWDMKRRHWLGEIDLTAYTQEDWGSFTDVEFTENNLFYPYPQNELVLNPELIQNQGY
ncbi:MAG: RagB/SusD family nutrient uptake outer membrane protein [Tunicatimonas sp.]|uniref:RagB/SusD family nutrient uptake outer membrane protein n=1 Tax=Tunicatimonas sp. TaxID=1940096 RepID=UPI003C70F497